MVFTDGSRDTSTWVLWLQSGGAFCDLRQPAGRPDMRAATCLDRLDASQMAWLAGQDGFAGTLLFDGSWFEWRRDIGYRPSGPASDSARLFLRDGILVEEGRHAPYVEEWRRLDETTVAGSTLRLTCRATGRAALLVRHAQFFMFARDRAASLPSGDSLAALVAGAASDAQRRALIDCEISFGRVVQDRWLIERSTLPYRERTDLAPRLPAGSIWQSADIAPDGQPVRRDWDVADPQVAAFSSRSSC